MKLKFGVSPAYYLSLFGEEFTCDQVAGSLPSLIDMGFVCWQPEIFLPEKLDEWETAESWRLRDCSQELGLTTSQFVAHFLLRGFESAERLHSDWGIEECRRILNALSEWTELPVVTIPLPAYRIGRPYAASDYRRDFDRLVEKLGILNRMIVESGRICGLEILPGSLLGGSEGVLRLMEKDALRDICVNLDTGHFHAASEPLALTLGRIGSSVSGTHLCDNDGVVNTSDEPGSGSVDWNAFSDWYGLGLYEGTMDTEIRCSRPEVEDRYQKGIRFLKGILKS